MKLLIATTVADARALEDKADDYLRATVARYDSSQWSDIYTDGTRFGIAFEDRLSAAFTAAQLGTQTTGSGLSAVTTYANVIDAQMAQPASNGAPAVAGWSVVPPPPVP